MAKKRKARQNSVTVVPATHEVQQRVATSPSSRLLHPVSLGLLLVGAIFLVYIPSFWGKPYLDDYSAILNNPRIKNFNYLSYLMQTYYTSRGWVQISLAIDWFIYSGAYWGLHLTNLILHIATAFSVWLFVKELLKALHVTERNEDALRMGFLAALFFALLPINTQAVTYVIARADVMATLFFALAMYFSTRFIRQLPHQADRFTAYLLPIFKIILAVLLGLGIGIGAKEIIITLPFMVLVTVAFAFRDQNWKTGLKYMGLIILPFALMICAYLAFRMMFFGSVFNFPDMNARPPLVNLFTQAGVIVLYYFPKILFPFQLHFDPDFELIISFLDGRFLFSILIILSLIGLSVYSFRKNPWIAYGFIWFFVTLAPTSSFIPLWDIIANRRIYLPSIGLALIFSVLAYRIYSLELYSKRICHAVLILCLIYLGIFTLKRNLEYTHPVRFWQIEYKYSPAKPRIVRNLLHAYLQENRMEEAQHFFREIDWERFDIQKSIRRGEDLDFLAKFMLVHQIQVEHALKIAEVLVQTYPNSPDYYSTLQLAYLVTQQYDRALALTDHALELDPKHLDTLLNRAYALSLKSEHETAIDCLERAVNAHPSSIEALQQLIRYYDFLKKDTASLLQRLETLQQQRRMMEPQFVYTF